MLYVAGAIALVAVAALILLVRFLAKGGGSRTLLWAALFVPAVMIAFVVVQLASVNYTMPVGWIIAIAVVLAVAIALLVLVGRSVSWRPIRVLALIALMLTSLIVITIVMIAVPFGRFFTPLFQARAGQIAEKGGFTALLPADVALDTDSGLPVDDIGDAEGLTLGYQGFTVVERPADGPLGYPELKKRMPVGDDPLAFEGQQRGPEVPDDADYAQLRVGDAPALGVAYSAVTEETMQKNLGIDPVNALIFERDGVEVRILSQGYLEYQPDGSYTPRQPLSFDELIEIAESLEPVE